MGITLETADGSLIQVNKGNEESGFSQKTSLSRTHPPSEVTNSTLEIARLHPSFASLPSVPNNCGLRITGSSLAAKSIVVNE